MVISQNLETFLGKQVVDWKEDSQIEDLEKTVYRIRITKYDTLEQTTPEDYWTNLFESFVTHPKAGQTTAFVIGYWSQGWFGSSLIVRENLILSAKNLSNLKAIFFGDITYEEQEMSWIKQCDMAPLLNAYPDLEHLTVRGGSDLRFSPLLHYDLKTLIVQTGGLPKEVIKGLCESELPALEHLELWLGVEDYGGDSTIEELKPILHNNLFPKLKYLGLCNSRYQNSIAEEVVNSPILNQLEVLNLSMGSLSDKGAAFLVNCPTIKNLKKLDLHHSYLSNKIIKKLESLGIELDVNEQRQLLKGSDEGYYVAASE